jgi:hypothetical protein
MIKVGFEKSMDKVGFEKLTSAISGILRIPERKKVLFLGKWKIRKIKISLLFSY